MADKLTRAQMEKVIAGGGSVMLDSGEIVSDLASLPTEAQLAKGDASREAAAREAILRQRALLDAQLASLGGAGEETPARKTTGTTGAESDELPEDLQGRAALLKDERFVTVTAVAHASDEDLLTVKGIAQQTLDAIREVIPAKG